MDRTYSNPIYHINPGFILCGESALEFMQMFSGYTNEQTIYVYRDADCTDDISGYTVIPDHTGTIKYDERNGIKYTTFDQTINDMLSNSSLEDPQAIMEALNEYLEINHGKDPEILPDNIPKYQYYKNESINYYNDGED